MTETIKLFDEERTYQPSDPEILNLVGTTDRQAQLRHYRRIPYFRLGRKIVYHGKDLQAWAEKQRIEIIAENAL